MIPITKPMVHREVGFTQSPMMRASSPAFAPPIPVGEFVPHDNYLRIITAPGPHTTELPGVNGTLTVTANNYAQHPVGALTRKGG